MHQVGARELKQHTGDVIARLQRGEHVLLTLRGAPLAVISPIDQQAMDELTAEQARKAETLGWLALCESTFGFWDNEDDAVWDQVEAEQQP
jgi:prevent-host-death family protein